MGSPQYRDDSTPTLDPLRKAVIAPFLINLHEILSREDPEIIGWSKDGLSFEVKNTDKLCSDVLPKYFRHHNFSSFQRQLNYFGFRRIHKASPRRLWSYCHKDFIQSNPNAMSKIKRKTRNRNQTGKASAPAPAPAACSRQKQQYSPIPAATTDIKLNSVSWSSPSLLSFPFVPKSLPLPIPHGISPPYERGPPLRKSPWGACVDISSANYTHHGILEHDFEVASQRGTLDNRVLKRYHPPTLNSFTYRSDVDTMLCLPPLPVPTDLTAWDTSTYDDGISDPRRVETTTSWSDLNSGNGSNMDSLCGNHWG